MNKAELKKTFDDAKFSFYESIAKLIVDNPTVSLAGLRKQHGITHYQMWAKARSSRGTRRVKARWFYEKPPSI
jgi:hypothetical protein